MLIVEAFALVSRVLGVHRLAVEANVQAVVAVLARILDVAPLAIVRMANVPHDIDPWLKQYQSNSQIETRKRSDIFMFKIQNEHTKARLDFFL